MLPRERSARTEEAPYFFTSRPHVTWRVWVARKELVRGVGLRIAKPTRHVSHPFAIPSHFSIKIPKARTSELLIHMLRQLHVSVLAWTLVACSDVDSLRAELSRAQDALREARSLLPALKAWQQGVTSLAQSRTAHGGYFGNLYVGMSNANIKLVHVRLWAPSLVLPEVGNVTLQEPWDKFRVGIQDVMLDSFTLRVERTDCKKCGWGQQLWASYSVKGAFAGIVAQPRSSDTPPIGSSAPAASEEPWGAQLAEARRAHAQLTTLLEGYSTSAAVALGAQQAAHTLAPTPVEASPSASDTHIHVLPLLRHLGGNVANVDLLWQQLIQAHPAPSRATVIEIGVAHGEQAMMAADLGVNVIAVEPKRQWLDKPLLVAKSRSRPNLHLVHAAATAFDGTVTFTGGAATTGSHIVREAASAVAAPAVAARVAAAPAGTGRRLEVHARGGRGGRSGRGRSSERSGRLFGARGRAGTRGGGRGRGRGGGRNGGRGGGRGSVGAVSSTEAVRAVRIDTLLKEFNISGGVYIVKIDVQGFELDVLRGMVESLRAQRVMYVLFEFWPAGMRKHAGVDAVSVLKLLSECGYAIFDTHTIRHNGGKEPEGAGPTFRRPTALERNVRWFADMDVQYKSNFGYWTDMVAVAMNGAEPEQFA